MVKIVRGVGIKYFWKSVGGSMRSSEINSRNHASLNCSLADKLNKALYLDSLRRAFRSLFHIKCDHSH